MSHFTFEEKLLVVQHCIYKYDSEEMLKTKLAGYFTPKDIESAIDTLIATQQIRRIGQDTLQNNESHTGSIPELPDNLRSMINDL